MTEGNPFFIEEVCKGLVAKRRLVYRDEHWQVEGAKPLEIPANVRIAIQSRSGVIWMKADAFGSLLCATEEGLETIERLGAILADAVTEEVSKAPG